MNPNDVVRDAILRHLYERHQKAKSPKSAAIGVRDLQAALKATGHKQQPVASNLDYLVQKGWVREVVENRTFTTARGTTQVSEKRAYKISDSGIDKLEAASVYEREPRASKINITNIRGVTVVGDGNIVNTEFSDIGQVLSDLRSVVLDAPNLSDEDRLNATADLDALQSQLQKPEPNPAVVKSLWNGIERVAVLGGASDLAMQVAHMLGHLVS